MFNCAIQFNMAILKTYTSLEYLWIVNNFSNEDNRSSATVEVIEKSGKEMITEGPQVV